jgi:hypothetical protein
MIKTIQVDITPEGATLIEGKNFTGKECDKALAPFEEGLGKVGKRTNKPEYHRTVAPKQKVGG